MAMWNVGHLGWVWRRMTSCFRGNLTNSQDTDEEDDDDGNERREQCHSDHGSFSDSDSQDGFFDTDWKDVSESSKLHTTENRYVVTPKAKQDNGDESDSDEKEDLYEPVALETKNGPMTQTLGFISSVLSTEGKADVKTLPEKNSCEGSRDGNHVIENDGSDDDDYEPVTVRMNEMVTHRVCDSEKNESQNEQKEGMTNDRKQESKSESSNPLDPNFVNYDQPSSSMPICVGNDDTESISTSVLSEKNEKIVAPGDLTAGNHHTPSYVKIMTVSQSDLDKCPFLDENNKTGDCETEKKTYKNETGSETNAKNEKDGIFEDVIFQTEPTSDVSKGQFYRLQFERDLSTDPNDLDSDYDDTLLLEEPHSGNNEVFISGGDLESVHGDIINSDIASHVTHADVSANSCMLENSNKEAECNEIHSNDDNNDDNDGGSSYEYDDVVIVTADDDVLLPKSSACAGDIANNGDDVESCQEHDIGVDKNVDIACDDVIDNNKQPASRDNRTENSDSNVDVGCSDSNKNIQDDISSDEYDDVVIVSDNTILSAQEELTLDASDDHVTNNKFSKAEEGDQTDNVIQGSDKESIMGIVPLEYEKTDEDWKDVAARTRHGRSRKISSHLYEDVSVVSENDKDNGDDNDDEEEDDNDNASAVGKPVLDTDIRNTGSCQKALENEQNQKTLENEQNHGVLANEQKNLKMSSKDLLVSLENGDPTNSGKAMEDSGSDSIDSVTIDQRPVLFHDYDYADNSKEGSDGNNDNPDGITDHRPGSFHAYDDAESYYSEQSSAEIHPPNGGFDRTIDVPTNNITNDNSDSDNVEVTRMMSDHQYEAADDSDGNCDTFYPRDRVLSRYHSYEDIELDYDYSYSSSNTNKDCTNTNRDSSSSNKGINSVANSALIVENDTYFDSPNAGEIPAVSDFLYDEEGYLEPKAITEQIYENLPEASFLWQTGERENESESKTDRESRVHLNEQQGVIVMNLEREEDEKNMDDTFWDNATFV